MEESGQIELAGKFFRSLTELSNIKPGQRSAAAFWAYRVEIRMGRPRESMRYLGIAAREVDSFYGVIARHALGQDFRISFDLPEISKDFYRWLNKQKGGKRLFALLQLGEINAAERVKISMDRDARDASSGFNAIFFGERYGRSVF